MKKHRTISFPLSEINITALVDIALTLLIIFVIISPFISQGLSLNLPKASGESFPLKERTIIEIDQKGNIYLRGVPLSISQIKKRLSAFYLQEPTAEIIIRADKGVRYERVIEVIDVSRESGFSSIGLATLPKEK
ncbi:biopolymer transporter ExbD [bacterium]|nr:biopolymer transporter ExbD [bacterium]